MRHKSVLVAEVLRFLDLKRGMVAVDGTLGSGGHSLELLKQIGPEGRLIGLDQDPAAIERARERLKEYGKQVSFHHENFENLDQVLDQLHLSEVNAVLLDIGFSSDQLEDASRGFSFERQGPLDMRMNPEYEVSARDLVNKLSERELADVFWKYGEERHSRKYARLIVEKRKQHPFQTTHDLARLIESALPFKLKIHPATRVFQALRITVNRELQVLETALPKAWKKIAPHGKLAVISFHSLEDRIVKHQIQAWVKAGEGKALTKKPVTASEEEIKENPRSRSAKLRVVEKIK